MTARISTAQILELIRKANNPANLGTGEMAAEIACRLDPGVAIRITSKGVRVTHSKYCDNLNDPAAIDKALRNNEWLECPT